MAGKFAAWPRRVGIAAVLIAVCISLLVFASAMVKAEQLVASWYGPGFEGNTTANGEIFDPSGYTAASRTYDFGTRLIVTYEGRSVVVDVNDRGPYVSGRDLDLSQGAAEYLGLTAVGVGAVNVEVAAADTPVGPYGGTKKVRREDPVAEPEEPARNNRQAPALDAPAADDQYAGADQYADELVEVVVEPAPPAPKPAVPVLPPEPEPAELESPPAELAVENSTVQRRVELAVAAKPEPKPAVAEEEPEAPVGITVLPDTSGAPLGVLLAGTALIGAGIAVRIVRR